MTAAERAASFNVVAAHTRSAQSRAANVLNTAEEQLHLLLQSADARSASGS